MEIDDSSVLLDAAQELLGSSQVWATLRTTVARLESDPSYVLGLTISLPGDPDRGPQHNLPIPDFDETGFFGRKDELRRIKKAIKGAYPVVSILGDGGIGKTSIALKVAYELLEDPNPVFDAFVWVTAKATILTTTEIKRINGAIETSLGLFAKAAEQLVGEEPVDPIAEVLSYMESFRILLILDNLETVLDQRLRDFLLDLPLGSKVMVTSRIGLGIENPVQLQPLSDDDSTRLLRALSRIRSVPTLTSMSQVAVEALARQMAGHPAYIRWFVAGVQSGRRPEDLVSSNELLLDFCMSNVYEYLGDAAKAAVRSMQTLPGGRNQAELAFLNEFGAADTQAVLLELLTTNFVQMSSQNSGETLDTVYQLSEFARQYLDKHHPVLPQERTWLLQRSHELTDLGFELSVESSSSPFARETVLVRGMGDVHAAKLLRDALLQASHGIGTALSLCKEAQILAPSYYETWRVEGHLHANDLNHGSAIAAFERALELAPESPILRFHFGSYLLNEAGDPPGALNVLQAGLRSQPDSAELLGQIAWAHYCLGDMPSSVASVGHLLGLPHSSAADRKAGCVVALRATNRELQETTPSNDSVAIIDLVGQTIKALERVNPNQLRNEAVDRIVLLRDQLRRLEGSTAGYVATEAASAQARLLTLQLKSDRVSGARKVGYVKAIVQDKRFGFIRADGADSFFHYRDLIERRDWDLLAEGMYCAYNPQVPAPKGPKSEEVRLLT
ncbi:MAG: AAA family ATPase [Kineosporiaceae bacterium]|nr:AAA family ATPase [Aeromicrobium sp.]